MTWKWNRIQRSLYEGSMFGKSPLFFAVWTYVLGHMAPFDAGTGERDMRVELNPTLISYVFGGPPETTPQKVLDVILELCAPDPATRSPDHEGRRLLPVGTQPHLGPVTYIVVNGAKYSELRANDTRREQVREAVRRHRAKKQSKRHVDTEAKS